MDICRLRSWFPWVSLCPQVYTHLCKTHAKCNLTLNASHSSRFVFFSYQLLEAEKDHNSLATVEYLRANVEGHIS